MKKAFFSLACMFLLIGNIAFAQKLTEKPCTIYKYESQDGKLIKKLS
ncbi:MAG: hypothetical protein HXN67_05690 [Prevotella pallens]|nr:hypothetical protein [Prevotella pallens]